MTSERTAGQLCKRCCTLTVSGRGRRMCPGDNMEGGQELPSTAPHPSSSHTHITHCLNVRASCSCSSSWQLSLNVSHVIREITTWPVVYLWPLSWQGLHNLPTAPLVATLQAHSPRSLDITPSNMSAPLMEGLARLLHTIPSSLTR